MGGPWIIIIVTNGSRDDNGDGNGGDNNDDKAKTMALTDSLTRPLAEERAGNVGRTLCCRAS